MALSVILPDKYGLDPGDGQPIALRSDLMEQVTWREQIPELVQRI